MMEIEPNSEAFHVKKHKMDKVEIVDLYIV